MKLIGTIRSAARATILALVALCFGLAPARSALADPRDAANACWQDTTPSDPGSMLYTLVKYPGQAGRWYVGMIQRDREYLELDFTETSRDADYVYLRLVGGLSAGTNVGTEYAFGMTKALKLKDGAWEEFLPGAWRTCGG